MDRNMKRKADESSQWPQDAIRRRTSDPFNANGAVAGRNYAPGFSRFAAAPASSFAPAPAPASVPTLFEPPVLPLILSMKRSPDIYMFAADRIIPKKLQIAESDLSEGAAAMLSLLAAATGSGPAATGIPVLFAVGAEFLNKQLEYLDIGNTVTMKQLLALLDASDLKLELSKYRPTAGLSTQSDLDNWERRNCYLAFVRANRGGDRLEIEARGRAWLQFTRGIISEGDRIMTEDPRKPLHILPEEVLRLKMFQHRCQSEVPQMIAASPSSVTLDWLYDNGKWSFLECKHAPPGTQAVSGAMIKLGSGRANYMPWFTGYLRKVRNALTVTPSTRVLADHTLSHPFLIEAGHHCSACAFDFQRDLGRFQEAFAGKIIAKVASIPFPQ